MSWWNAFKTHVQAWWRDRNTMEKIQMLIFITVCILTITFFSTKRAPPIEQKRCSNPQCLSEASKALRFRNDEVNSCRHFYPFVCGRFPLYSERSERLSQREFQREQLLGFYKAEIRDDDHEVVKSAKKLFQACMKTRETTDNPMKNLTEALRKAGGWPVAEGSSWNEAGFNWIESTYLLRRFGYPYAIFLDLTIEPDPALPNDYIFKTATANVTDYLYDLNEDDKVELMTEVALVFGAEDRKSARQQMVDTYEFWKKLNVNQHPANGGGTFVRMKLEEYANNFKMLDWVKFNNELIGKPYTVWGSYDHLFPPVLKMVDWLDIISATPKRVQANYMMWRVIEQMIPYMHCEMRVGKGGVRRHENYQEFCMREAEERFVLSPMRLLADRMYLTEAKRERVQEILKNFKSEFSRMVENAKWIEEEDREELVHTVRRLAFVVGRPDEYFSDDMLDKQEIDMDKLAGKSFLSLITQANKNLATVKYSQYNVERSDSLLEKWYINKEEPAYIQDQNILYIPGAVIQRFFHEQSPNYLNYGKLGAAIAHHLGDVIAVTLNRSCWSKKAKEEFEKEIMCLEKEIKSCRDNLIATECRQWGLSIAKYTIGQKIAHAAYMTWQKKHGPEVPLTGTPYTPKQLFWMSAASMLCPRGVNENVQLDFKFIVRQIFYSIVNDNHFSNDFKCDIERPNKC